MGREGKVDVLDSRTQSQRTNGFRKGR